MQIMPATGKGLGLKTIADLHNPEKAVPAGLKLLKMNIQHCGSVAGGLSRYNSGSCKAYKNPKWAKGQTYHYVPAIVAMAKKGK